MADLISRQTAIDALNKRWGTCILGDDIADGCANVLNALPSAQPDIPGINVIIDTIKNAISASTGNDAYMVGLRNGMRWCLSALTDKESEYEDMPSAQPGWIPCCTALPKENGYYLTTTMYNAVCLDYWNTDNFDRTEIVLAWMPLPTPWKGEQNERFD